MWNNISTGIRCLTGWAPAVGLGIMLVAASPSAAEQLHNDPFLYVTSGSPPPGQYVLGPLAGQPHYPADPFFGTPWLAAGFSDTWVVQPSSLEPGQGGSAHAVDNGITHDGRIGRYLTTPWDNNTNATYYLSCLVNYGTTEGGDGGIGYRSIEMWPAGGTIGDDTGRSDLAYNQSWPPGPHIPELPTDRLMLHTPWGSSFVWNSPRSYNEDGYTHLVVLEFELSDVANSDTISVYLDPLTQTKPEFPGASIGGIDLTLSAIGSSDFGGGTVDIMKMDEIRVGTEYADVIPPEYSWPPPPTWQELYDIVMSHMNLKVTGGWTEGDIGLADGTPGSDGRVTIGDFRVWKDNYPSPGSGSLFGAAVPEPSSLVLVLGAAVACLCYSSARRHRA